MLRWLRQLACILEFDWICAAKMRQMLAFEWYSQEHGLAPRDTDEALSNALAFVNQTEKDLAKPRNRLLLRFFGDERVRSARYAA